MNSCMDAPPQFAGQLTVPCRLGDTAGISTIEEGKNDTIFVVNKDVLRKTGIFRDSYLSMLYFPSASNLQIVIHFFSF